MFKSGRVLCYISEYSIEQFESVKKVLDSAREKDILHPDLETELSYLNTIENLPIGTVICKVLQEKSFFGGNNKVVICLPMFSSHISMPVKTNEIVWFFEDEYSPVDQEIQNNAPFLTIRNYWLSRKIGSRISEDLNYSFHQRDSLITSFEMSKIKEAKDLLEEDTDSETKKEREIYLKSIENNVNLPDFENEDLYRRIYGSIIGDTKIDLEKEKNKDFYLDAVPRWFSKSYELTLQGSNNSIINLTNTNETSNENIKKGAIDLVAGRHAVAEFIEKNDFNTISYENKNIENLEEDSKERLDQKFEIRKDSFPKIKNTLNEVETLKSEKFYLGSEVLSENVSLEGRSSFENDASRIYISEVDNLDNSRFYDLDNLELQTFLSTNENKDNFVNYDVSPVSKDFLQKEETIKISNNFESFFIDIEENISPSLPSVLIKSNNLSISLFLALFQ